MSHLSYLSRFANINMPAVCPIYAVTIKPNKFEKLVHLFDFIIRIYHDARSPERQNPFMLVCERTETQPGREKQVCLYRKFYLPLNRDSDFQRIHIFSRKFPLFLFVLHKHDQDGIVLKLLAAFITFGDVSRPKK